MANIYDIYYDKAEAQLTYESVPEQQAPAVEEAPSDPVPNAVYTAEDVANLQSQMIPLLMAVVPGQVTLVFQGYEDMEILMSLARLVGNMHARRLAKV